MRFTPGLKAGILSLYQDRSKNGSPLGDSAGGHKRGLANRGYWRPRVRAHGDGLSLFVECYPVSPLFEMSCHFVRVLQSYFHERLSEVGQGDVAIESLLELS